jgi:hypothetical protein
MKNSNRSAGVIFFSIHLFHNVSVSGEPDIVTSTCIESEATLRHKAARKKFILPKHNGAKP